MPDTHFLSTNDVMDIHRNTIQSEGGDAAVRDAGILESAVSMPMAWFEGRFLHEDVPAMAAAYLFHICQGHAFVDGNKRTAVASAIMFLELNAWQLTSSNKELLDLTLRVAQGELLKDQVIQWVRDNAEPQSNTS